MPEIEIPTKKRIIKGIQLVVPRLPADGMALFPFILIHKKAVPAGEKFLNHERIHLRQQVELLILPFYFWYLTAYLYHLIRLKNHHQAYRNISFEKEAYTNADNPGYLQNRTIWAFLKY